MFAKIKRFFYFPVASYFGFFAAIRLKRWNPRIIVITGSSGKTTLLHLIESQLGDKAKYSHEANSSFGIPFDILDIHRKTLTLSEWPIIFLLPWVNVFKELPRQKIYVVEADCDRPYEGDFLSRLLMPEVTLWTNVGRTHTMNFESPPGNGTFHSVDEAVAHEFGHFAKRTESLIIANGDLPLVLKQLEKVNCRVNKISTAENLKRYEINLVGTKFNLKGIEYTFPYLLPKETATSILMCLELLGYLGLGPDKNFANFRLPPGRNSYFKGIKNTTIVDSTYNANLDSMKAIINMFGGIKSDHKWVVLGDMLELGSLEEGEHKRLAGIILKYRFDRIILMGPRVSNYTYPILKKLAGANVTIEHFLGPKEVLDYLAENIKGGELILFKGARFLEGVVGKILHNKKDIGSLVRREKAWEIRRKKWGV